MAKLFHGLKYSSLECDFLYIPVGAAAEHIKGQYSKCCFAVSSCPDVFPFIVLFSQY